MSRLTTKNSSTHFRVPSLSLEQESISSQIDRLTQVIQSITNEKLSPDSRIQSSRAPSLDSFIDSRKYSVDSSIYDEEFLNKLEKTSMAIEDFRSHELRKSLNSQSSSTLILELACDQIETLTEDLLKIKNNSENTVENIISISGKQLIIRIKNRPHSFVNKKLIGLNFTNNLSKLKGLNPIKQSSYSINDLEKCMAQSFKDSFSLTFQELTPNQINTLTVCDLETTKLRQQEHQRLIQKLSWQITEVSLVKEQLTNKQQNLAAWESALKEKQAELQKQENKISTQRLILEKDKEILTEQKKSFFQYVEENKKKSGIIKGILSELKNSEKWEHEFRSLGLEKKKSAESIVLKPRRSDVKSENDPDIQTLEKEIQGLENQVKGDKKCPEYVQIKLDRLKTRLSSLRSKRVINATLERSNSVSSKLSFLDRKSSCVSVSSSFKSSLESQPLLSNNNINRSSKALNTNSPKKQLNKPQENNEGLQKYMKLRENRLIEKEEELSKRENMLVNNWGKHPDNLGLVQIVQNEHRNLKILRNDLEKKQRTFEQQVLAQSRKCSEFKVKEKEVQQTFEHFEKFLNEKKQLESKLLFLLNLLETVPDDPYIKVLGSLIIN